MKILVLNSGSSSIKFQLIETDSEMIASNTDRCLGKGIIERIGTDEASLRLEAPSRQCKPDISALHDHQTALDRKSTRLNSSHIQKSRMPSSA